MMAMVMVMVTGSQASQCVCKSQFRLNSKIIGWRDHARTMENFLRHFISIGHGIPRLSMRVQEDPNFSLAREITGRRDHARALENRWFSCFVVRLVTGSQASQCVCRRIPISAWFEKLSAGETTHAQ